MFALVFVVGSVMSTLLILKKQVSLGPLTADNIVGIIFYLSCSIFSVLLFKIAQKFRFIMVHWTNTESHLSSVRYKLPATSFSIHKRILVAATSFIVLSTVEHVLYLSSDIYNLSYEIKACNQTDIDAVEVFVRKHLDFITESLPFHYNHFLGLILEYINFSLTFYWNFLDLFIILICIGISFLFDKLNWRLQNIKGLLMNEPVWEEIRYHHNQVIDLMQIVNSSMGEAITLACFVDGYFILVQLLQITM